MKHNILARAAGLAAISAMALGASTALAKDAITIAVPSFLTGGAAGPFGIPAMNGAKMVADAINAGKLPAPYDAKGFGGATATIEPIDEVGAPQSKLQNIATLLKSRVLTLLLDISHQAIVKLLRQSQRN